MALPEFNASGNLPEGIHTATLEETQALFGIGSRQRHEVTERLLRIYHLIFATGYLDRFVLFGSYITAKPAPNDVDIILVMQDDFDVTMSSEEVQRLLDHQRADKEFGASIFYIRRAFLIRETLEQFLSYWQTTREGTRRGLVEIIK